MKTSGTSRLEFRTKAKRQLAERVAYICSNPSCRKLTVKANFENYTSVKSGKAAHIYPASLNGPRSGHSKPPEYVQSFENGIWLCDICAREIDDNQSQYTSETLQNWKHETEIYVSRLTTQDILIRQIRLLCHGYLSALRILSGLPSRLDQTFDNPNGNNINITRLFMELELILTDYEFYNEAKYASLIAADLDKYVCPFIYINSGKEVDICEWKMIAVKTMMIDIMHFKKSSFERYIPNENYLIQLHLAELKKRGITPIKFDTSNCLIK